MENKDNNFSASLILGAVGFVVLVSLFGIYKSLNTEKKEITEDTLKPIVSDTSDQTAAVDNLTNNEQKNMNVEKYIAVLKTNYGTIQLQLLKDKSPATVENFIKLANSGFYNGTKFHRVIKSFMIQGGDPLSKDVSNQNRWGTGGPGYSFADEFGNENNNVIGSIAMANSGPNTNGSQFFINTANNNFLDTKHTVFGKVVSGMDVVTAIETVDTDKSNDRPVKDVVVESVIVE